ncbi:nuclear transport factor 2 family protein [Neptunitalea lumnitzerae]|uniref:SnoaL-like domain-containing protein n=1 Tax=Neptunitalea lumnitzerae TaxID=2965509 RepID=A0ABQ5MGN9_9FLAO|nr:nuclear transport factor 2 family protein [Neptunitalea sp. Y10]GLB48585.1 hypothetical protein Y10_09530 [Neptunitalea sp. Y10]
MKKLTYLFLFLTISIYAQATDSKSVGETLDKWHKAAADTDFKTYFDLMSEDAIFIGTDATENWNKKEFMAYAKPYFDAGSAWSFTAIERHIFFNEDKTIAWFDELLNTQMKICRGSGVLIKEKGIWKIQHYVLSMTIPNENVSEVITIKAPIEDKILQKK